MSIRTDQRGGVAVSNEQPAPAAAAGWHWFHYPVGIFLVAYGAAGIPLLAIGWNDRHHEMAAYLSKTIGLGIATQALVAAKVVEVLLTLLALAGLLRERPGRAGSRLRCQVRGCQIRGRQIRDAADPHPRDGPRRPQPLAAHPQPAPLAT